MIPVSEPKLDGREKELLIRCVETGWISSEGPFVGEFEQNFASYLGVGGGVAVCNGTAALETALYGLGVRPGDEVIMPSFTIISCAFAAMRLGAKPVLVDIDPETWCMDPEQVKERLTPRTRVVMAVHIYGHPVNMDPLLELARGTGVRILEDAAEVHGAEYCSAMRGGSWIKCGAIGDAAAFSFYANKIITTGEGGMVVSRDEQVLERARSYRNLGFRRDQRFYHSEPAYNFRMTNLQGAIGVAQLERIEEFIAIKRHLGKVYRKRIEAIPGIRFQPEKPWARAVHWMYAIQLDPSMGMSADAVRRSLQARGIGTRPFFTGLHRQPVLRDLGLVYGEYPNTDRATHYGLYLPSGLTLTENQVGAVCDALREVVEVG